MKNINETRTETPKSEHNGIYANCLFYNLVLEFVDEFYVQYFSFLFIYVITILIRGLHNKLTVFRKEFQLNIWY